MSYWGPYHKTNRYYEGYYDPYNRHATGIWSCYRKSDNKYMGQVCDCRTERDALFMAEVTFDCKCYVDEVEE